MALHPLDSTPMSWTPQLPADQGPLWKALADRLEADITSGVLAPGTRLPPQRALARYLGVNLSTVTRAIKTCQHKGLVSASVGNGTYVSSDATAGPVLLGTPLGPDVVEMGAIVPAVAEHAAINRCIKQLVSQPGSLDLLSYGTPEGTHRHRQAGSQWLAQVAGLTVPPERVTLASGGQNAILSTLGALFRRGDKVGVDALTYPGVKLAARLLGIRLVPVACAHHEMTEEGIRTAVTTENIRGLYVIPDFHNPWAHTMGSATRELVAHLARRHDLLVVEDAINTPLAERPGTPLAQLAPERTVYLSSLSKCVSAGLRCAFIAAPASCYPRVVSTLYATNVAVAPLLATVAAQLVEDGTAWDITLARRRGIAERNRLVNEELAGFTVDGAPTCPLRWLRLPPGTTGARCEELALAAGAHVYGGEHFAVGGGPTEAGVRLSVTTPKTKDELVSGLQRLAGVLRENA